MARIIQTGSLSPHTPLSKNDTDWIYNGLDCCVTLEVLNVLLPQLDETSRRTYNFSLALQAPVLDMSMRGILIDQVKRDEVLAEIYDTIFALQGRFDTLCKHAFDQEFNWRSSAQLKKLFYNILGLKEVRKRNAAGQMRPTINRDALEKFCENFYAEPLCNYILAMRDLDKKRQFLETPIDKDGRIRSNFNIAGTTTGRFNSRKSDFGTGTNLQNIDRALRSIFIADPGYKLANLDLEQADARNVGAICWNLFALEHGPDFAGAYLDACESGDLHTKVCSMGWPRFAWSGDVKKDREIADQIAYREFTYRDLAKRLGHGTNYLGHAAKMAQASKSTVQTINEFQRNYFAGFPCIPAWHTAVEEQLKSTQSITTLMGRRRYFWDRVTEDSTIRDAVAFEPQSCTADQINTGLLRLWRANRVQLLDQVHDSVLFQFPQEMEDEIIPWALKQLEVTIGLRLGRDFTVPTDAETGWNWGYYDKSKNPEGMKKWKGTDLRTRSPIRKAKQLSFNP